MFQFPGLSRAALWVQAGVAGYGPCRVAPFGDPGIEGCLLLPRDYRSLPRPSSTSYAKASAVRPCHLRRPHARGMAKVLAAAPSRPAADRDAIKKKLSISIRTTSH